MGRKITKEGIGAAIIIFTICVFSIVSFFNNLFSDIDEREYERYVNYGDKYSIKHGNNLYDNKRPNLNAIKFIKSIKIKDDIVQIDHVNSMSINQKYKGKQVDTILHTAFFYSLKNEKLSFEYYNDYKKYLPISFYNRDKDNPYDVKVYYILSNNDRILAYGFNKEHVQNELRYLKRKINKY